MKISHVIFTTLAILTLTNNANAANKTHVTDSLGAGNSSMEIGYAAAGRTLTGPYVYAAGSSFTYSSKTTANQLTAAYYLGVTDNLDMGIFLPVSGRSNVTADYTIGANKYNSVAKYEGQGDVSIGARYLFLDKQKDSVSWNAVLLITPSTASSDAAVAEVTTNGTVTTAGKTGGYGNGYLTTAIASTVSVPTSVGDIYLSGRYTTYGEKTTAGVALKSGAKMAITFGIEKMIGDKTTVSPYVRLISQAAGYSGTTTFATNTAYDLGLNLTNDISKNVSVNVGAEYNSIGDNLTNYANGDKLTLSGSGYALSLSTQIFF
ncbi:MAG TPA: hypothetical protein VMV48_15170 [Gallionellaceae bacterium]|nr:hypothetical protein [Gallionellaceae bacterium]